ncbi:prephenate dehydrogenase dimerization domain-containing protein [Mycobacteroides sp. LB1]|uniref:prephenate dehydrogenase dimerization domain-containing protein n=1 Tax=Mycobacteroides sp. LB1 TaxID=2750814 RepID=UPI0015DFFB08|nr:prephenate dehydrogenase/arogenate dehydrogenase family protein [Mycobacteroides sp. LB1]
MLNPLDNVIVVGGAGAVGALFANLFAVGGLETTVVDLPGTAIGESGSSHRVVEGDILQSGQRLRAALTDADLVLLAVPENVVCAALPVIASLVKPGALLADTLSVKATITTTWASVDADVEAMSLNPMFAPSLGAQGRPVAAVVLRDGPKGKALVEVIEDGGFPVVLMGPDEHDAITASVQALTHSAILSFGTALLQSGVDIQQLVRVAPPPFQALLALLARVSGGTPEVYWDIQHANPHAPGAREALSTGLHRLNGALAQGESNFGALFAEINDFLGPTACGLRNQGQDMLEALPASWPNPLGQKSS